jgi:glycosyltransferase involved in cell wall biosynthesis
MSQESLNTEKNQLISLVFFGRLEERKGLCTFISAIKSLPKQWQQKINIIFMGKVVPLYSAQLKHLNSEQYIEQELDDNISYEIISDFYSQQAIEYIRELDHAIVCLTSPQENFPNTALEMGQLPVSLVVSDTGGFRETLQLVQRTEGLYWFKPKDADSLTEKLEEALTDYPQTPKVADKNTLENINQKLLQEKIAYIENAFAQVKTNEKPTNKVTLGIISHNQGKYLVDCLSSIETQTYSHL